MSGLARRVAVARGDEPADLVVRGGTVLSVFTREWLEADVAIADGFVAGVGDYEGHETIDATGRFVVPGFVDAHNHVRLGSNPGAVSLTGATSLDEIHERIGAHVAAHPDAAWIEGEGWNYAAVPGGRPTAAMLEGVGGGRPAFLYSYDVHTVWLNREAMEALGVRRGVEHLPWGTVEHDPGTGEPTGYVHDFAVLGISEAGQRALEPFVPAENLKEDDPEKFLESLTKLDAAVAARVAASLKQGKQPRYLARITPGAEGSKVTVGPIDVEAAHPAASLRGSEAFVAFHTERYRQYPLVVRGEARVGK